MNATIFFPPKSRRSGILFLAIEAQQWMWERGLKVKEEHSWGLRGLNIRTIDEPQFCDNGGVIGTALWCEVEQREQRDAAPEKEAA